MVRALLRLISPSQWVAPLLTSLVFHAFLLVVAVLLWSGPEQRSDVTVESIKVDLVVASTQEKLDKQSPAVEPEPVKSPKPKPLPATADRTPVQQPEVLKPSVQSTNHKQKIVAPSEPFAWIELDTAPSPVIKTIDQGEVTVPNIDQKEQVPHTLSVPKETADLDSQRAAYLQKVSILIDRQKNYPLMARKSRQQGTTLMAFTLTRDGLLNSCQVKQSSGYRLLDRAAEKAVRKVRLFPPPPVFLDEQSIFQVAIGFQLDN